uniref:Uncharacterized protein n=1 Tax=Solanum tuberosum TaxID=4113 RepID=M1BLZ9_SOLTU
MGMCNYEETMATATSVCWDIKRTCLSKEVVISKSYSRYLGFFEMKHDLLQMEHQL